MIIVVCKIALLHFYGQWSISNMFSTTLMNQVEYISCWHVGTFWIKSLRCYSTIYWQKYIIIEYSIQRRRNFSVFTNAMWFQSAALPYKCVYLLHYRISMRKMLTNNHEKNTRKNIFLIKGAVRSFFSRMRKS